eukprot:g57589.t1
MDSFRDRCLTCRVTHARAKIATWNLNKKRKQTGYMSVEPASTQEMIGERKQLSQKLLQVGENKPIADEVRPGDRQFNIECGSAIHPEGSPLYPNNYVITSSYTVLTFLPKNLLEQFQNVANIYFLLVGILQMIPSVSTTKGVPTMYQPLIFIVFVSGLRAAVEDYSKHISDAKRNSYKYSVIRGKTAKDVNSGNLAVGDIVKVRNNDMFPADMIFLGSSLPHGHCFIDKANLNGETCLEIKNSVKETKSIFANEKSITQWRASVSYEPPNGTFDSFRGILQFGGLTLSLDGKVLLMREEVLRNTEYVWGLVVYTGNDTKIQKSNSSGEAAKVKVSRIMRNVNNYLKWMLLFQVALCLIAGVIAGLNAGDDESAWYLPHDTEPALAGFLAFWSWFILLSQMVPISLIVSSEMCKFILSMFISWDLNLYWPPIDKPCKVNNSTIHEDLGLVDYVFSDKTGTLTQNKMQFRYLLMDHGNYGSKMTEIAKAVINRKQELKQRTEKGDAYVPPVVKPWTKLVAAMERVRDDPVAAAAEGIAINEFTNQEREEILNVLYGPRPSKVSKEIWAANQEELTQYMRHLALSNTIEPYEKDGELKFQAESAEELAMVQFAQSVGFVKRKQNPTILEIHIYDHKLQRTGEVKTEEYRHIATFGFTSQRARVTVIYQREWDKKLVAMCKGQDTVLLPLIEKYERTDALLHELKELCNNGLRTLVMSHKELPVGWWDRYAQEYKRVVSLDETDTAKGHPTKCRSRQCHKCIQHEFFETVEKAAQLGYLGCMGLEDQLQPLVPECIRDCLAAGIKVWMITGDKLEAAKNIGLACNLIDADMEPSIGPEDSVQEVMKAFQGSRLLQITGQWASLVHNEDELGKMFDMFDSDDSKTLTLSELNVCLEALNFSKTEQIYELFSKGDLDQDGITKAQFIDLIRSAQLTPYEAVKYDIDESINRYMEIKDHSAYPVSMLVNRDAFHVLFAKDPTTNMHVQGQPCTEADMEDLREKFFLLASVSKSVVFARAEPAMKKRMVTEIQARIPKAVTLAIGDGANDTDMITAAHVGVGIAGVEGTAAVNSADYAIGTFMMLHTLLFVQGYWNYHRITELVYFIFYKACLLAVTGYFFGWFSRFSGQQFFNDPIYQVYNVCLTAFPIMALAISDQRLDHATLQNNPIAYAEAKGRAFRLKGFFSWIFRAFLHGFICFFIPYIALNEDIVGWKKTNGWTHGLWYNSTVVYITICIMPNILVLFSVVTINAIMWLALGVSFLCIFSLILIANILLDYNPDLYGVVNLLLVSPHVWLIFLLACVSPILLELLFRGLYRDLRPSYSQILQERILLRMKEVDRREAKRLGSAVSNMVTTNLVDFSEYDAKWAHRKHRTKHAIGGTTGTTVAKKLQAKVNEQSKNKTDDSFKMHVIRAMLKFRNMTGSQFDSAAQAQYQVHDTYVGNHATLSSHDALHILPEMRDRLVEVNPTMSTRSQASNERDFEERENLPDASLRGSSLNGDLDRSLPALPSRINSEY